jgi:4-alpha-glucanotransferase
MLQRIAGLMIPLFSLRTADDLGRGEIRGLVPMADFALATGHRMLQLLPIDETAPGETSPYSAMSVLAIDPLYISLRGLDGISAADLDAAPVKVGRGDPPDHLKLNAEKVKLLRKSFDCFVAKASASERSAFDEFQQRNHQWLHDYTLFRALKERFRWSGWATWPDRLDRHEPAAIERAARELATELRSAGATVISS